MGVTYYLSKDAVLENLKKIAKISQKGSLIVFDYLDNDAFDPDTVAPRVKGMILSAKQMGEEIKSGLDLAESLSELKTLGLRVKENLSPADIQYRFFSDRNDKYYALEHLHFACLEVL